MRKRIEHVISRTYTNLISRLFKSFVLNSFESSEDIIDYEIDLDEETEKQEEFTDEELPEFQQIIPIDQHTLVGIEYLDLLPDETAIVRVVTETSFSKQYKKKVYTDRSKEKYIHINNEKHYITKARVRS